MVVQALGRLDSCYSYCNCVGSESSAQHTRAAPCRHWRKRHGTANAQWERDFAHAGRTSLFGTTTGS